ncbi:MAG: response regulator [Pedobacter sp.]|nr:MAG: response regulator [Pedobacter sp.]
MSKVLIIDDEILVSKFLETRLKNEEIQVDTAHEGLDAIRKAEMGKYDLILTDLMVPNIGGQELIMRIQRSRSNSNTPIIVLSSLSSDELIVDVLATGVKDYVVKPFSINVLIAKIKQQILEHQSAA